MAKTMAKKTASRKKSIARKKVEASIEDEIFDCHLLVEKLPCRANNYENALEYARSVTVNNPIIPTVRGLREEGFTLQEAAYALRKRFPGMNSWSYAVALHEAYADQAPLFELVALYIVHFMAKGPEINGSMAGMVFSVFERSLGYEHEDVAQALRDLGFTEGRIQDAAIESKRRIRDGQTH